LTTDLLNRIWFVEEKIKASKSALASMKTKGDSAKTASSSMQSGVQRLDISVDFTGVSIAETKNASQTISSILTKIKTKVSNLKTETNSEINKIENSAAAIELEVNESTILAELDDIEDATDDLEALISNLTENISKDATSASLQLTAISGSLNTLNQKLNAIQSKVGNVKKQRDDILPQFNTISSEIDNIVSSTTSVQKELDAALQRIASLKSTSPESIVAPITTRIEPVTTQKTHFNTLFPTLLVLVIMITGILLSSTLIIVEKKSKAFFRNSFTPTSYFTFNLSTYLTSLIVLFIQLILFASVSAFFFETEVLASIGLILLLVFLTSTVFICIGMFVGFIFKTEETANLAAITLIAVFLFFSSAVIPLESLPEYLKDIAVFNPFVVSEVALKQTMLFQFGFDKVLYSLSVLAGYAVGIFLLLILLQNALKRLSFVHFSSTHLSKGFTKVKKGSAKLATPTSSVEEAGKKQEEPEQNSEELEPKKKWYSGLSSKNPFKPKQINK
jgi:ABC-type multidrug transport system permease subunit